MYCVKMADTQAVATQRAGYTRFFPGDIIQRKGIVSANCGTVHTITAVVVDFYPEWIDFPQVIYNSPNRAVEKAVNHVALPLGKQKDNEDTNCTENNSGNQANKMIYF